MRRVALVLLIAVSCTPADERAATERCERAIATQVRSPSTIEYVGPMQAFGERTEGTFSLLADFDAANAYGTPVRHVAFCHVTKGEDGEWGLDSIRVE